MSAAPVLTHARAHRPMSLPEFCERRARVFASRNEFGRALFYTAAALRAQHSPLPTWQTVIAHAFAEAYR